MNDVIKELAIDSVVALTAYHVSRPLVKSATHRVLLSVGISFLINRLVVNPYILHK